MASRAGLAPDAYWQTLHPKAKEHHLSRVGAPVAPYVTAEQYGNSQAVGANSMPNAFLSNNPVLAGYDGNPMQPGYPGSGPSLDVSPALSPNRDAMVAQDAPGALSDPARSDASIVTPRPGQNPETLRNALLKRPGNRTQDIPGYGPVGTPVSTAAPQTDVPPANDLTAAALLKKQEGVLAQDNIGQRQKLETMIRDLEQGLTSAADLPRLEQLKAKLSELGGPTSENVSTPEYDSASEDYTRQLKDAQVMAIEARPTVNAARTEMQNLLPLMSDPNVSDEIKASVQSRIEDAQAIIAQSEADAGSVRGVAPGAPGYTQPYSMEMPEQAQPVLSNPEQNTANFRPAPGGQTTPVLEDPTAAPTANSAILSQSNVANTTAATAAANSTSKGGGSGGGSGGGNRTTGSTAQSTSRSMSPSTGNARGSQMGYGKANTAEMLMRVGGAMQANAVNGYGAAMGAASNEYGMIQDQRRAADTAAYEAQEKKDAAKRLAEAKVRAAGAKAGGKGGKAAAANAKALTDVNDAMYSMQRGLDAIADSRAAGGNLTGIGGIFKGLFDNFTGDADANRRLTLSRLKVDDALLRTAETKGAISNIEMALFLEPAPKNTMDEQVWVDWLNERMRTLRGVQYRLQTGEELPPEERSTRFKNTSGTSTPSVSNDALSDGDMAYIK